MLKGVLIAESLKAGTVLDGLSLQVTRITRSAPGNTTSDQASVWTLIEFEASDDEETTLSAMLADALDSPGWYADFHSEEVSVVVFPGRVFRYRRGDSTARAEAEAYARTMQIPDSQLDWPD